VYEYVARRGAESETTRAHRLTLIREVCRFLRLDDARVVVPDRRSLRIVRQKFLRACSAEMRAAVSCKLVPNFRRPRISIRADVLGTALCLLYLAGLRAGELLRLTQADLDLETGALRIRHSKFNKSRLVPLAPDLVQRIVQCRVAAAEQ